MKRITQGRRSILKQATKYAAEHNIVCYYNYTSTTISASKDPALAYSAKRATEIKDPRKVHQRSRRTEMAWSLHQQTMPRQ